MRHCVLLLERFRHPLERAHGREEERGDPQEPGDEFENPHDEELDVEGPNESGQPSSELGDEPLDEA